MVQKSNKPNGVIPLYRERTPERPTTAGPKAVRDLVTPEVDTAKLNADKPREVGGPKGPEPTRFGDWERNGRCVDF